MTGNEKLVVIGRSHTIVWVKVISGWVCFLLYYWSLVAPALFPERFAVSIFYFSLYCTLYDYAKLKIIYLFFLGLLFINYISVFRNIIGYIYVI